MEYKCHYKENSCQYNEHCSADADKDCDEACEFLELIASPQAAPEAGSECMNLLNAEQEAKALKLLKVLAGDLLPAWHSECNCYSTEQMKKIEYAIDAFLESI